MKKYILIDVFERNIITSEIHDTHRAAFEAMVKAAAKLLCVDPQEIITAVDASGEYGDYDHTQITESNGWVNKSDGDTDWAIYEIDTETWVCSEATSAEYQPEPFEKSEEKLFFKLDGEDAERHGAIGYLRFDFGRNGNEFWSTWFDIQGHLNTEEFKAEFDKVINHFREGSPEPPFSNRNALEAFCRQHEWPCIADRSIGFKVRTADYTYYARCRPCADDYDVLLFAYDNRYLLPELSGQKEGQ